jgi:hypothetical protein
MYQTIGEWIWEIFSQIYKSKWPGNAMWSSPFSRIIISMGSGLEMWRATLLKIEI